MARAVHPVSYTEALHRAPRLPGWPRVKPVVAARWLVTVLALWLILRSIDFGAVLGGRGRSPDSYARATDGTGCRRTVGGL